MFPVFAHCDIMNSPHTLFCNELGIKILGHKYRHKMPRTPASILLFFGCFSSALSDAGGNPHLLPFFIWGVGGLQHTGTSSKW